MSLADELSSFRQRGELGTASPTAPNQLYIPDALRAGAGGKTQAGDWNSASSMSAQLTRAQWQDWITRFAPYETRLKELAMGQTDNQEAEQRAGQAVSTAFNTSQGSYARNRARYGLSAMPGMTDQMALSKTATQAAAINQTRQATRDRDMALLTGGLNDIREG